ncbi:hypothetical protein EJB05_21403, partial [Eragrostis curvula]
MGSLVIASGLPRNQRPRRSRQRRSRRRRRHRALLLAPGCRATPEQGAAGADTGMAQSFRQHAYSRKQKSLDLLCSKYS